MEAPRAWTQHIELGVLPNCNMTRRSADWGMSQLVVANMSFCSTRTESDYIENFDGLVYPSRSKAPAVLANSDALDFPYMGPKLLDSLNANGNLFPEFDHAINRARDEEIGEWCHGHKRKLLFVHQGL